MGNTGAAEAPQNSEQSLSTPAGYAASRRQLLSLVTPFSIFFPLTFLYRSIALPAIPPPFLSVILTLPAFLFFCHSLPPPPPNSPTSLTTALHLPLTNPTQGAVSAALADLDVMKLQVCQCCVCVYRSEEIYAHNK